MSEKGYLPHHVIKAFVFWILTVCIAVATLAGILQSWGTIGNLVANRCVWSAVILALGSLAFLLVNRLFGDLGRLLMDATPHSPPVVDPAFAERLKRAKAEGRADG
jgi:hypothetical protein